MRVRVLRICIPIISGENRVGRIQRIHQLRMARPQCECRVRACRISVRITNKVQINDCKQAGRLSRTLINAFDDTFSATFSERCQTCVQTADCLRWRCTLAGTHLLKSALEMDEWVCCWGVNARTILGSLYWMNIEQSRTHARLVPARFNVLFTLNRYTQINSSEHLMNKRSGVLWCWLINWEGYYATWMCHLKTYTTHTIAATHSSIKVSGQVLASNWLKKATLFTYIQELLQVYTDYSILYHSVLWFWLLRLNPSLIARS